MVSVSISQGRPNSVGKCHCYGFRSEQKIVCTVNRFVVVEHLFRLKLVIVNVSQITIKKLELVVKEAAFLKIAIRIDTDIYETMTNHIIHPATLPLTHQRLMEFHYFIALRLLTRLFMPATPARKRCLYHFRIKSSLTSR